MGALKETRKWNALQTVWKNIWQTAAALLFILLIWSIAHVAVGNDLLVPSVADCLKELGRLLTSGSFWRAFLHTFLRVFYAFGLSFLMALVLGLISYMVPWFGRFLSPIVSMFRSLPTLAILLILLVWAGAAKAPVVVAT